MLLNTMISQTVSAQMKRLICFTRYIIRLETCSLPLFIKSIIFFERNVINNLTSHMLACRLLLMAQELYLMLPFSRTREFRNFWKAFCIHGKFWSWLKNVPFLIYCSLILPVKFTDAIILFGICHVGQPQVQPQAQTSGRRRPGLVRVWLG
jgi:hypothetical protein